MTVNKNDLIVWSQQKAENTARLVLDSIGKKIDQRMPIDPDELVMLAMAVDELAMLDEARENLDGMIEYVMEAMLNDSVHVRHMGMATAFVTSHRLPMYAKFLKLFAEKK